MLNNIYIKFRDLVTFLYLKIYGVDVEFGAVTMYGFPQIVKAKGSKIIIRRGSSLVSNSRYNVAGINHPVILATMGQDSVIEIDGAGISGGSLVAVKKIYIGQGSGLGANSNIYDTDFHLVNPTERKVQNNIFSAKSKEVTIGKNVWISSNVNILKGVCVGDNSVIGCGSVVTSNVDPNCFYAGIPAKKVRKLEK